MNTRLRKRAAILAVFASCVAPLAHAQNEAPLRLVVGYAAGGPVDGGARTFAPVLARELGRTVLVENRPGAAGVLGADAVSKAAPDGNTLYFGASPTLTISPHVQKSMTLDPVRDLTPVAPLLSYANVLVVNKDLPFQTLEQLIAYAKANPGKLFYGSAGVGASNHLSGELLAAVSGTQLNHVPYKGNAPAMTDVIGGQLSMMFDITSTARNFVQSGRVRALAVTSRERNASLPNVPTMREGGLPGYEVIGWYGLYGPARMAPELAAKLNAAANRALADPELRRVWQEQGYELWAGKPDALAAQQARDLEMWRGVTRGIKVE
jgi:tripartite-type tricarboxylate transporter receptor subunit TctC